MPSSITTSGIPSTFKSSFNVTHIGTATAILNIDGVNFLTDPYFSTPETKHDVGEGRYLTNAEALGLQLNELPPIDCVLLSHEDHADNLDEPGRTLLNGRHVLTTLDGAKNLAPRPAVKGLAEWETVKLNLGGKEFTITGTPCVHYPGGEVTGFLVSTPSFGADPESGLPNAIYVSGDTIYTEELATEIPKKWNVVAAVLNLGKAMVPHPDGKSGLLQITMSGKDGAKLCKDIGADILVPMHFESWEHFTQYGGDLRKEFEDAGAADMVCWLEPGKEKTVI